MAKPNKTVMVDEAHLNGVWLGKNYENLKQKFNDKWVIIEDQKIVKVVDSFDEVLKIRDNYKSSALHQFITSKKLMKMYYYVEAET